VPPGDGGDHAVNQAPRRDAGLPTSAVDAGGALEVGGRVEPVQVEPQQEASQIRFPGIGTRSGEHFHDHWLGDGDRAVGRDQFGQAEIDRAPGRSVVFNPG
jgi:hypothetical protein